MFKDVSITIEAKKDWRGNEYRKLKDSVQYHYTENDVPFCVIIDGVWYERGKMGRMVFGDAKIAAESELKAGEKLTEGAIKDSLKKSLEDTTKHLETRIRVNGGKGTLSADYKRQTINITHSQRANPRSRPRRCRHQAM